MKSRLYRIYADTSVFGGCLDPEFSDDSQPFFDGVRAGRFVLLLSEAVLRELKAAPETVRGVLAGLPQDQLENVEIGPDVIRLQQAYLAAKVVPPRYADDATHVAAATIARADAIVSWNFKHHLRLDKMRAYNAVNLSFGYGIIAIMTPREIMIHGQE